MITSAVLAVAVSLASHQVGVSRGVYLQSGAGVDVELTFARGEVARTVPALDQNGDGTIDERELAAATAAQWQSGIVDDVKLASGGAPCAGSFVGASMTEGDGLSVRAHYACASAGVVDVDMALTKRLSSGHRHLAHTVAQSGESDHVAFASAPRFSFGDAASGAASSSSVSVSALASTALTQALGLIDALFLVGLLSLARTLRSGAIAALAFCAARSLSAWAIGAGVVAGFSPAVAAGLAAVSVLYIGVESVFVVDTGRARIAALWGIVHGAVAADGVNPVATATLAFAVDAARAAVILALVLLLLKRGEKRGLLGERSMRALSVVVAVAGAALLVRALAFG